MRVLLSPAKTFRKNALSPAAGSSQPQFLAEAETLMARLRKKSPAALVQLMDISPALAEENAQRHLDWSVPFHPGNAKAALLAFHGEVYRNLGADQWTGPEFEVAQRTLRIISGLYGLLRPLDLIQEYRLEMGTSWAPGRAKNLYAFWGTRCAPSMPMPLFPSSTSPVRNTPWPCNEGLVPVVTSFQGATERCSDDRNEAAARGKMARSSSRSA